MVLNDRRLKQIINNSGKGMSDVGLMDECDTNMLDYLFFEATMDPLIFLNGSQFRGLYLFLEQNTFYYAACLPRECHYYYEDFF